MRRAALLFIFLLVMSCDAAAHPKTKPNPPKTPQRAGTSAAHPGVSLSPRFMVGETFRYQMSFETSTATARSGFATDPQGPSSEILTWNAAIRLDVLPGQPAPQAGQTGQAGQIGQAGDQPGAGMRLRITYEKSAATVRSDTFDPNAAGTEDQYHKLEGKVLEFVLDANGKLTSVSGLEEVVDEKQTLESARQFIDQLAAGAGAPARGVAVGEKWTFDQDATALPLAGMVWHAQSDYLRDDPCPQPAAAGASPVPSAAVGSSEAGANPEPDANTVGDKSCAVIQTHLNLIRPKPVSDPTPEEFRKNDVRTSGNWTGSIDSTSYISLRTGLVVSMTQTGNQDMDVTLTNEDNGSMRYSGTIRSRSEVALVAPDSPIK